MSGIYNIFCLIKRGYINNNNSGYMVVSGYPVTYLRWCCIASRGIGMVNYIDLINKNEK